ncbi:MAG: hypothetical protein GY899_03420 [Verrucomicrobiaceae bacterium]|nr:hypothetical protein [Verrucomicrobiaceae bacterium]
MDRLRRENPEILLIGNSMLYTRIDIDELQKISGKRISQLAKGGGASACWYLYLKNIVAQSGIQPEQVVIFFRDTILTSAEYRTEGQYGDYLKRLQEKEEPVMNQILESRRKSPFGLSSVVRTAYKIDSRPHIIQSSIHDLALDITKIDLSKKKRKEGMNTRFSVDNLRRDLALENADYNTPEIMNVEPQQFTPAPGSSFLPHIIDLADKLNTKLSFYQVKNAFERTQRPLQESYIHYLRKLKDYLKSRNVLVLEESVKDIPEDWFAEGDHISKDHRLEYTRLFWSHIKDSILATK